MDALIEAFGSYSIGYVVVLVAAFIFLYKIYRKVAQAIVEQHDVKRMQDEKIQQILDQESKYPEWRKQSLNIQEKLTDRWITSSSRRKVLSAGWKRSKRNASGKSVMSCGTDYCRRIDIIQIRIQIQDKHGRRWRQVRFGIFLQIMK